MRILYAIQGTGNGHLSRAGDIIPLLAKKGQLDLLVSGTQADIELPYPVKFRFEEQMAEYLEKGIHVMVAQNSRGELVVGDSHQYAMVFDPFDRSCINQLIVTYLKQFAVTDSWQLTRTWNGTYSKMTDEQTELFVQVDKDVYILNGLGGAGITLSFGLAEELVAGI